VKEVQWLVEASNVGRTHDGNSSLLPQTHVSSSEREPDLKNTVRNVSPRFCYQFMVVSENPTAFHFSEILVYIYIYTHTYIYIYIYIYTFFATNVLDTEICDTDSRCLFVHTLVCVLPYPHIPFKVQYYNE